MSTTDFGRRGPPRPSASSDPRPPSGSAFALLAMEPKHIGQLILYALLGFVLARIAFDTFVPRPEPVYRRHVFVAPESRNDLITDEFKRVGVPIKSPETR